MPRVIHRSLVLTLEVVASDVQPGADAQLTAAQVTAAIADAWLLAIGASMAAYPTMPAYQITMRQLIPEQGAQIQILLCWFVLQAQRQEISDFEATR